MRPSWEPKPTKNRSKNGVQDGMHLGIDFLAILVDFGYQVGVKNRSKIDQKWHRKNDWKKKGSKMADKTLQEPTTPRARGGPGPGRGGRGRGKPLPRGLKIERLKTKHRYPTLNHPSPEGWWDFVKKSWIFQKNHPKIKNPTSPLGLGGLAWGVCFQPLFFQPFWFQPSGEGFTPPPTPSPGVWTERAAGS